VSHRRPDRREGNATAGWVLLDYGDVVVHIFAPTEREYYRLEELWANAPAVVRIQ
jgi:ribosome-associated protein